MCRSSSAHCAQSRSSHTNSRVFSTCESHSSKTHDVTVFQICLARTLPRAKAAIDDKTMAGDIARGVGSEIDERADHFVGWAMRAKGTRAE